MSVTIAGIKGYEYQYKATVLLSLSYNTTTNELYVEKQGSEDALLIINKAGNLKTIEVQVKSENSILDIQLLTNWLCHFKERSSDNNLLERIISDPALIALFITNSRCNDDTVGLRTTISNMHLHNVFAKNTNLKNKFILQLGAQDFGDTTLKIKRKKFCVSQSMKLKPLDLSQIFERILILEEFSDERLDSCVLDLLNKRYQIAQSNAKLVYLKLLDVVKFGRDSKSNIIPACDQVLQDYRIGRPVLDPYYEYRDEERTLTDLLTKDNILLLTGISLCGKSELAKRVAAHFFDKGYDFKLSDDIDEINRFLATNPLDNKIAILEDPWGHSKPKLEFYEYTRKIVNLISNAQIHHKVIVTSRIEIIFEIFKHKRLNMCSISNRNWIDLTIYDKSLLLNFWANLVIAKSLSSEISDIVSKGIFNSSKDSLLQIGQLIYLVNQDVDTLKSLSYSEIENIARRNSSEIADRVFEKNEFYAEVLSVLALCCNHIYDVTNDDLVYIFTNTDDRISFIEDTIHFSTYTGYKKPVFPKYKLGIKLDKRFSEALEYLEEKRLIRILNNKIRFTHPNYFEAGKTLLLPESRIKQIRIIDYLKNCISCLSPNSAYLATKHFSYLYKCMPLCRKEILKIAFETQSSIFPSVVDSSLIFLINNITRLPKELIIGIQSGIVSETNIYWHNNVPFISNHGTLFGQDLKANAKKNIKIKNQLQKNFSPSPYDAWTFLESIKWDESEIPLESLKILLQYNEAFIRQAAVEEIFKRIKSDKIDDIIDIFSDEHPSVVFTAIRSTFNNWYRLTHLAKDKLISLIKSSLLKPQIAIRAFSLISNFSVDYAGEAGFYWKDLDENQKREVWNLWGELYPLAVKNVPVDAIMNTARFSSTIDEAFKYLSVDNGINVLNTWLDRVDTQIKKKKVLDEFEMFIGEQLMVLTNDNHIIRQEIFNRLINYKDTSFLLSSLKGIVEFWDVLHISEREKIKNLTNTRVDSRWIKAVLINSYNPLEEILLHILGEKSSLNSDIEDWLALLPEQLLRDSLNVYCGFPQPFWWLAVHHHNRNFWNSVIRYILLNNYKGYDICLYEFLSHGVNGFSSEWSDWKSIWKNVCDVSTDKDLLFYTLCYNTANSSFNIPTTKLLWSILLESYSPNNENAIISLIAQNVEMLQIGDKDDIFNLFEKEFIFNKLLKALPVDSLIIDLLHHLAELQISDKSSIMTTVETIKSLITISSIKLFITYTYIDYLKNELPIEVVTYLSSIPNTIIVNGERMHEKMRKKFEYKLSNWIGTH